MQKKTTAFCRVKLQQETSLTLLVGTNQSIFVDGYRFLPIYESKSSLLLEGIKLLLVWYY